MQDGAWPADGEVGNEICYAMVRVVVDAFPGPIVVAGDFNTPVESVIYRTVWGDLANAFDKVGRGYGITQRVSVKGFSFGARIDHVLAGKGLVPKVCEVGPDIGSDHLPVIADIGFSR
ncbi:endonuclease/exonuclease/phosphatase family protein [Pelotalea chapellei]|uniref:Endonuclease/exonuclease/phosphatase family protein n=1 Tax=Pelotalea chapellei TaxID=44671 RepID=A0ABS5U5F1_9BACT|nr:endonuclease/exonuclease/phosphatase family protein [Pelotalea chapellei]MBT1070883.1 endonuclease/exonuclease/phosphatase family protein [Pelotalea chapellei]